MEERLASLRSDLEADVEFRGSTMLASEFTDIPAGQTLHIQYQWEAEDDSALTYTSDYYTLVAHRTTYSIYLSTDSRVSGGVAPIFEAMIGTFAIDSPGAHSYSRLRGRALSDNTGELRLTASSCGRMRTAGEMLTISAIADRLSPAGRYTAGGAHAGWRSAGRERRRWVLCFRLNASISELELPQAGARNRSPWLQSTSGNTHW
jgi:hypothetical protein